MVIPNLIEKGMELRKAMVVNRLEANNGKITAVHAVDKMTGEAHIFKAKNVVLSAGALGFAASIIDFWFGSVEPRWQSHWSLPDAACELHHLWHLPRCGG